MQRKSNIGRNLALMLLISFSMVNLPVSHVEADFVPTSISDSTLARNFAPVLVLTKNPTRSGRKALHPEPVEIMGADSVQNVWFSSLPPGLFLTEGRTVIWGAELPFPEWNQYLENDDFLNVYFAQNKFAFLKLVIGKKIEGFRTLDGSPEDVWLYPMYFDYPGTTKQSWNQAYDSGPRAGENYPNTVYARVFPLDPPDNRGSVVIKYFCFYPYNDFTNNHEGDWTKINLLVTSRDPEQAELYGVDFKTHKKSIVYIGRNTDNPSTVDFSDSLATVGSKYPVIYVGAGSHAHYPKPGLYPRREGDENLTPHGIVLHPAIENSVESGGESYKIVMLPTPDPDVDEMGRAQVDNMGLAPEMSWLGADLLWGTPMVDSPDEYIPLVDANDAPRGPLYKGWSSFAQNIDVDLIADDLIEDDELIELDDIPDPEFHHFAVVGDVTWSGNISLKGDIVIFPGATLTVQPGTVVEFEPETDIHQFTPSYSGPTSTITEITTLHYEPSGSDALRPRLVIDHTKAEIYVYGSLVATGTATDSIRFRQKSVPTWTGDYAWVGIRKMRGGSTAFHHTEVRDTRQPESRPTSPRAEAGDGQVTLTWRDAYPEDPSITGWEYRTRVWAADLAEDAGWGSWTDVSGGADTREAVVNNLGHGEMHQFQLRAVNSTGAGPASKSVKVALMQVSYSAGTYEAVEPNPEGTTEGHPAQVTVRLTPAADRSVSIPITVTAGTAEASDYTVSGLDSGNLLDFVGGDNSKRFTIQAESDIVEEESGETLELGFGSPLPVGVRAGTPSTATVTLSETGTPGTIPDTLTAGLGANSTTAGQIRVVWDASTDMAVSGYTLRFEIGHAVARDLWAWPGIWNLCPLPALGVDSTGFTHRDLQAWRRYRYQVQATNPHGDSEWSTSFPPSGVTPVPNKAAAGDVSVEPSEQSSEESEKKWEVEFIVLECSRPPCEQEEFEPFPDPDSDPDLPPDSGPAFPIDFEVLVNSGGVLGAYRLASPFSGAPGDGEAGGGASGTSGASGARGASSDGATATSVRVEAAGDTVRVSGLADTVVHQIRVRLVNADGVPGEASDSVAVVPLRAQAGDGQVTLSWDSPGHDRLEEWQYRQRRGLGSWGDWQEVTGSMASTTSHTVTGLANGEVYGFQVRGVYQLTAGSYRAGAVSFSRRAMPVGKPDAPGNLEADPGDAQVVLTWQTPFNNGSSLTGYEYRQSSDGAVTWSPAWGDISDSDSTTASHTLMSLSNGTEYTFEVRAVNAVGEGDSSRAQATPGGGAPDPPRRPEASGANGQVELSWDAPLSDGGTALTGYEYRQGAYQLSGGERTWSDWTAVPSPEEALPTSLTLSVGSCTTYYFEVRARNAAAAGDSVRVLALAPKWSGSLSSDTTWSGAVCVDGEVSIPSGVTLSLGSGTEVSFSPGALIVAGTLGAGPGVTFRSSNAVSPSPSDWSGIRVESGGSADLSGATIRDGGGCVQAHTSGTVTMTNTTLSNCEEEVSLSTKRPQPGVALTASLEGVSAGSWQWQGRNDSDSAPWSDLSGSSQSASYTPLRADLGRQLRAMVRYVPDAGSYSRFVQSEPTRGVMLPPPTGFEVWPDHEAVLLLWDASADASITHWRYGKRKRPAKMEWTKVADGDVDSLEYEGRRIRYIRVEDLTNGVEYLFRVRAKSAAAEGVLTDPVLVTPVQPQVAYGASSYEAREGGAPVPVEVALSPKATRAVALPVTVTADAGVDLQAVYVGAYFSAPFPVAVTGDHQGRAGHGDHIAGVPGGRPGAEGRAERSGRRREGESRGVAVAAVGRGDGFVGGD